MVCAKMVSEPMFGEGSHWVRGVIFMVAGSEMIQGKMDSLKKRLYA
jgi:hypothetical protein